MEKTKILGRSGIKVSALGLSFRDICQDGRGLMDSSGSIHAIHCALDSGINFLNIGEGYGYGEMVAGKAMAGRRDKMVIAVKPYDPHKGKTDFGEYVREIDITKACETSLAHLQTDYIDLYLLPSGILSFSPEDVVIKALESLLESGKILAYGICTDTKETARRFSAFPHCAAIQYHMNFFHGNEEITKICEEYGMAGLIRSPLAKGFLTGKYNAGMDDARNGMSCPDYLHAPYLRNGKLVPELVRKLEMNKDIFTCAGRTLAQGALSWLWAKSKNIIPIPGFRTALQAMENAGVLSFGPLTKDQMEEINRRTIFMENTQMQHGSLLHVG